MTNGIQNKQRLEIASKVYLSLNVNSMSVVRDRPFNLQGGGGGAMGFFSVNTSQNIYFCCRIYIPEFNIRLYDKNSESDFFFPPPKSEYFFSNIGNQNIFFKKKKT